MAHLHQSFAGNPEPTNVLTFVDNDSGDVAICPQVASTDARIRGWNETAELVYLCVHGSLHTFGFDHKSKSDAERMRRFEIQILSDLGINAGPLESLRD